MNDIRRKVETGARNKQISEMQTIYSDKTTLKDKFSVNGERIQILFRVRNYSKELQKQIT